MMGSMMRRAMLGDGSTLNVDFTSMTNGGQLANAGFTFTNATTTARTYINASGIVATATTNEPRFDHDPTTVAPRGLLIEGSATNVLTNSNALTSSGWAQIGIASTTQSVSIDAPSGLKEAWIVEESTASGYHVRRFTATTTAAAWTFSFWAKAKEHDRVCLGDQSNGRVCATFVLTGNGTAAVVAGAGSPTNPTIVRHQNGWYRCSVTATMTAVSSGIGVGGYPTSGTAFDGFGVTFTGTSGNGVYLYGFQAELGSGASSYIPTGASQVQRLADECSMTGTNFSSWYNQSEGTVLAKWRQWNVGGNEFAVAARFALASGIVNSIWIGKQNTAGAGRRIEFEMRDSSGAQRAVSAANPVTDPVITAAGAQKFGDTFGMSYNGVATVSTAQTRTPAPDRLFVGSYDLTSGHINSTISRLAYWPTRLPDATLQSLTT